MTKITLPLWKIRDLNAAIYALPEYTVPFKFRYAARRTAAAIGPAIEAATEEHGDLFLRDYYSRLREIAKEIVEPDADKDALNKEVEQLKAKWGPKEAALKEEVEVEIFRAPVPEITAPAEMPEAKANATLSALLDSLWPMFADENA